MTKHEAVQEIARSATTAHVQLTATRALKAGTDAALTTALVEAAEHGQTGHVVHIAKTQLGYTWNGRHYETTPSDPQAT